jgi:hypothetical protein
MENEMSDYDIIKKGHVKDAYTKSNLVDLMRSTDDPIFFIEKFIKVQHPTRGSVPLILYDYQRHMITGFHENRFVVGLTARQMGKCLSLNTKVTLKSPKGDEYEITIGEFYEWQRFKQWAKELPELQDFIRGQQSK